MDCLNTGLTVFWYGPQAQAMLCLILDPSWNDWKTDLVDFEARQSCLSKHLLWVKTVYLTGTAKECKAGEFGAL